MRTIESEVIKALQGDFDWALLIRIKFKRGNQYWTNYGRDLSYGGKTYNHSSSLRGVGSVTDQAEITVSSFTITLQNVDRTSLGIALNQPVSGIPVDVWAAVIQNETILGVIGVQLGATLSTWSADESSTDAALNFTAASSWADFDRVNGRRTTLANQQRFFPNDTGFKQAHSVVQKIKWGG